MEGQNNMMELKNQKAQGAMEYLMTYSWAILVVMLVGISLWQLGVFDLGASRTSTFTGFATIRPHMGLSGMRSDGTLTIVFLNGGGGTINPREVTIDREDGTSCSSGSETITIDDEAIDVAQSIPTGDNFVLRVTGLNAFCQGDVGDPFAVVVAMTYDVTIGSTQVDGKRTSGVIRATFE